MELSGSFLKAVTAPPPPHLAPRLLLQHSSALLIGGDERHFQLPVPISTSAWSWALAHFLGCMSCGPAADAADMDLKDFALSSSVQLL